MRNQCPICHHINRETSRFCLSCGTRLLTPPTGQGRFCKQCGTENDPQANFCKGCGTLRLTTAVHPPPVTPPQPTPVPVAPSSPLKIGLNNTGGLPPHSLLDNGRYRILKVIGRGGMGAVYLAEHTHLCSYFAIKEMSDTQLSPSERPQAVAAFRQEANLLAKLTHPNLPDVSDNFSENSKEYLVMEYVDGENLEKKLANNGGRPLPESDVLRWAEQLCDVLHYLHSQNPQIIFRDLKPANVMINKEGQVKLIDFGIVRFFKPGKKKDTTAFGSPGYSPPEQYGQGQTDPRSDVYALAATLHHVLTGMDPSLKPFQFQPANQLNPKLNQVVSDALGKALQSNHKLRWPDMMTFKHALVPSSKSSSAQPAQPAVNPAYSLFSDKQKFQKSYKSPPVPTPPSIPSQQPVAVQIAQPSAVSLPAKPISPLPMDTNVNGRRWVALIVDNALIGFGSFGLLLLEMEAFIYELRGTIFVDPNMMLFIVWQILALIYHTIFLAWRGQTIGKMMLGIKVLQLDGSPIGWLRSLWRTIVLLVTVVIGGLFCLGIFPYMVPFLNDQHRATHDFLAGTIVTRK